MTMRTVGARFLVCLLLFASIAAAATAEAKLYAIIVTPIWEEGWLGEYSKNDREALTTALSEMAAPKDLAILRAPGSWSQTIDAVRRCPAGADDAILVFFSGHGGYNERDGHFLVLPPAEGDEEEFCPRTRLRTELAAKKARLTVLMSNCCFNYFKPDKQMVVVGAPPPLDESSPLFTSLFLKPKGIVDITSCQKDRKSVTHYKRARSLFVDTVADVWESRKNEALNWDQCFLAIRDSAAKTFDELYPEGQKDREGNITPDQVALAFRLPGDTALDRSGPRFGVKGIGTQGRGVRIGEVYAGFPGLLSGLQVGDLIVEINGRPIRYEQDYDKAVDASGQDMELTIERAGRKQALTVRLRY